MQAKIIIFDLLGVLYEIIDHKYTPIEKGIQLLQLCTEEKNEDDKPLHRLFLLSNTSRETYDKIALEHPSIFEQFEGVTLAQDVGVHKPNSAIFTHFVTLNECEANQCIFIDDDKNNVLAAQSIGMTGIVFDRNKEMVEVLEQHEIIS